MQNSTEKPVGLQIIGIIIFYQIIMNSSWILIDDNPWWKLAGYFLYAILLIYTLVKSWSREFTLLQTMSELFMLMLLALYLMLGNLTVVIVFLFAISASHYRLDQLIDVYLYATIAGVITVSFASLIGLLPVFQIEKGYWLFGFGNPNALGYYLVLVYLLLLFKYWNRFGIKLFFIGAIIGIFTALYLADWTAILALVFVLFLKAIDYMWPKFAYYRFNRFLIVTSSILFTLIAFFLAWGWTRFDFVRQINRIFTSRPDIWNHYLVTSQMKLIGSSLPDPLTYARGAFDGAYVYYPFANGLLLFLVVLAVITCSLHFLVKQRNTRYIVLFLTLLLFAFSETTPFFAYQSPLLPLAFLLGMPGFSHLTSEPPLGG